MTTPLVPLALVVDAVCQHLHNLKVGYWPGSTGTYPKTTSQPPIYVKRLPSAPVAAYAVTAYNLELDAYDPRKQTVRIQIRSRNPFDADQLADRAVQAMHAVHHQTWGPVTIHRCKHLYAAQLGADPATRLDERTDNYELEVTNAKQQ